ncbi:MAG: TetR/AcrR family transcriptional regulator [Klebsiella pneumoniae]|nr:TetR/AcrR family transcriptional regulator [Klebsiella pneumoniae]
MKSMSSPVPPPDTESKLSDKARVILQAATKVFLSHGFSAATTDMIQREAGVSKSTVYAHFASKDALFRAVIKAECATSTRNLQGIEFRPGYLRESLTELAGAYLDIVLSTWGLSVYRVVIAEGQRFPELARTFYLAGPLVIINIVARHLEQAVIAGEIALHEITYTDAARVFINLVRSEPQIQCLTHPDQPFTATQKDRWAGIAVNTFMRAYGKRSAAGHSATSRTA